MKVVCIDNTGAALTVGAVYEARRDVNFFYYRIKDNDGNVKTFLEQRFCPYRAEKQTNL